MSHGRRDRVRALRRLWQGAAVVHAHRRFTHTDPDRLRAVVSPRPRVAAIEPTRPSADLIGAGHQLQRFMQSAGIHFRPSECRIHGVESAAFWVV